jgi:hypothetical protein
MLDPKALRKNGFGAFIAREQERHFARDAEAVRSAQADGDSRSGRAPGAGVEPPDAPAPGDAADGRSV